MKLSVPTRALKDSVEYVTNVRMATEDRARLRRARFNKASVVREALFAALRAEETGKPQNFVIEP